MTEAKKKSIWLGFFFLEDLCLILVMNDGLRDDMSGYNNPQSSWPLKMVSCWILEVYFELQH